MTPHIFNPPNRLAKILVKDAPSASDLIKAADTHIENMGDGIRSYVADRLKPIVCCASLDDIGLLDKAQELGRAGLDIAEVAGLAGMANVGEVARGLSATVDSALERGTWVPAALRVHINAIILFSQGADDDKRQGQMVLQQLRAMRASIGVKE